MNKVIFAAAGFVVGTLLGGGVSYLIMRKKVEEARVVEEYVPPKSEPQMPDLNRYGAPNEEKLAKLREYLENMEESVQPDEGDDELDNDYFPEDEEENCDIPFKEDASDYEDPRDALIVASYSTNDEPATADYDPDAPFDDEYAVVRPCPISDEERERLEARFDSPLYTGIDYEQYDLEKWGHLGDDAGKKHDLDRDRDHFMFQMISPGEYGKFPGLIQCHFRYYPEDDLLVDEDDLIFRNNFEWLNDSLGAWGAMGAPDDRYYFRNFEKHIDIEVVRRDASYYEEVLGIPSLPDESDPDEKKRLQTMREYYD